MIEGKIDWKSQTILVTGGTGSFGKKFTKMVLQKLQPVKFIVYSRDELKQFEMQQEFPVDLYPSLRYFIGDVRDLPRLRMAMEEVDIVVHTAALKQVPATEYNPFEAVKTNIIGGQNVIDAAISSGVKRVIVPTTLSVAEQIEVFSQAEIVVGPHSSGFQTWCLPHRRRSW